MNRGESMINLSPFASIGIVLAIAWIFISFIKKELKY